VYAGSAAGIATIAQIKQAIVLYGTLSTAVAAGNDWDNYQPGQVLNGPNQPMGSNHAVVITGWDDTTKPPSFTIKNSWGKSYGAGGYLLVGQGCENVGDEAFAVTVSPAPAPPTPPGPTPPPPPPPTPSPTVTITITGTLAPGTYEVVSQGTVTAIQAIQADVKKLP
jgi:hypothetical protein